MKIFVSAAEISSDLQAEKILGELVKLFPEGSVKIAGIGGPKLRALPGFQVIEEAERLRTMGFTEVIGKLFTLRKVLQKALKFLNRYEPDLILTFDYPDFHMALLKQCQKNPKLKSALKICGIPPKIWVWRSHRIELIRKFYDAVWVLFPFEKDLYEKAGIPVIYEGNPLLGEVVKALPAVKPEWNTASSIRLAVLPGSREAEITQHLDVIPETLKLLALKTKKKIVAEVPMPAGLSLLRVRASLVDNEWVIYQISEGNSAEVLARNSLGLIKSGTSTLEAASVGCVPIIFYRVSFLTRLIFQFFVRYRGAVGLPNILLGVKLRKNAIFPEFLGPEATPETLSAALFQLINDPAQMLEKQKTAETLRKLLVPETSIPKAIAGRLKEWIDQRPMRTIARPKKISLLFVSLIWSSVNGLRRFLHDLGIFKTEAIALPSILVGNLQVGGAGKTPLVIALANEAVRRGYKVGVVSRAYSGTLTLDQSPTRKESLLIVSKENHPELVKRPDIIGDEPCEIFASAPGVTLGLGANRVQISKELESRGIEFLIFDDGFQNLKFKAAKTVLAVTDALPSQAIFRDFLSAHRRADFVFQTKGMPHPAPIPAIPLDWEVLELPKTSVWLLCAVADPEEVAQFYRNRGVRIERVISLPDHARFDLDRVKQWEMQAKLSGSALAVTMKDFVKLKSDHSLTLFVLRRKISSEGWLELIFKR
jgi:lipid-A-disaccharide synthase